MTELTGRIVVPGDQNYNSARTNFNTRFDMSPHAIVFADRPEDVANCILWCRENGVSMRPRSARHDFEGFSLIDEGIVLDVSCLNSVQTDLQRGIVRVGAGTTLLPLYEILWREGVTIPAGTCPTVGVAGLTLGGGIGFLSRAVGLTCDNLVALELVDSEGRFILADEWRNNDLLWASRGGGGNLGIVTTFVYNVYPICMISYYQAIWPLADIEKVFGTWQNWAPFADERLSTTLSANKNSISSTGLYLGSEEELRSLVGPLLEVGAVANVEIMTVPYIQFIRRLAASDPSIPKNFKNTGAFVYESIPTDGINIMKSYLESAPSINDGIGVISMGGAIKRIPPEASAFFHRHSNYAIQYTSTWLPGEDAQAHISWAEEFRKAMLPFTVGDYINWPDIQISDLGEYHGTNIQWLREIKTKYDPDNFFNSPQSIPPI